MNSFYAYLTVQEHLDLILDIKNIKQELKETLIVNKLNELGMIKYRHYQAHQLSGGNQRKLNYAIASICHPELLFLDEPTSSMDPISRKRINENIVLNKNDRCTIF